MQPYTTMEIKSRRYQSPVTRPTLVTHPANPQQPPAAHPRVILSGSRGGIGHTASSLVTFSWGSVVPMMSRR